MKVIFLDIDGVLNSDTYDKMRREGDSNIDESRLELLHRAVLETEAKIVLTSSWRRHWSKNPAEWTELGEELHSIFEKHGMEIYDKTPIFDKIYDRKQEIEAWLREQDDVQKFVIVDDLPFGWGNFGGYLIKTNAKIGRGLEEIHVQKIIESLNGIS